MATESTAPPQSFWRAAPIPEADEDFSLNAMIGHYAAMYRAHAEAYSRATRAASQQLAGATGPDRKVIGVALRAAIVEHLQPSVAAWTSAALLTGMTPQRVWECYDDPQVMDELAWEWLVRGGLSAEEIEALTTVPVKGEDGLY